MKIFDKFFRRNVENNFSPMPSWEEVVAFMYDKYLDAFADEVVDVVYSKDKSMRYVVLKDEKGLLTFQIEAIYQFDEEEWKYICSDDDTLPAMWEPFRGKIGSSFFENIEELFKEMKEEPEYKQYFE